MHTAILGLLAETPIHPGTGRNLGVVDLPVAREATTDLPVLVGSSLKGALRDRARDGDRLNEKTRDKRFGKQDGAGDLLVSDARLLLLPVRSLTGTYRWATCPLLLERLDRDRARAGAKSTFSRSVVKKGEALTAGTIEDHLFLEERQFKIAGNAPEDIMTALCGLIGHQSACDRLADQLAILHNDDFTWFARYSLSIQARNVLNKDPDHYKQSKNLWYEETLPPDTLMYALVMGRDADALGDLRKLFPERDRYLQAGGNETVGQGWFHVKMTQEKGGKS